MELVKILLKDADRIAPLVAAFRAQLKSYKGIIAQPDIEAGNEEIIELLSSGFLYMLLQTTESWWVISCAG